LIESLVRLRALLFRCLNLYFGRYISIPYKNWYVHNRIPLPNNRSTLLVVHLFRVTGVRAILVRVPGFWRVLGLVTISLQLSHQEMRSWWFVKTPGSACLLLEIRWQKGRQADRMCTCTHSLPTFWAAPSNFLSLPCTQFDKKHFHTWEKPILVACP
jgi:hypothetical protein